MLFMILVVMAALAYLISNLTPEAIESRRNQQTQEALVQAREALISYALTYPDKKLDRMYGYLPMPDIGKRGTTQDENCKDALDRPLEGCQAPPSPSGIGKVDGNYLPTLVGRFPWRTLGMPPLRDGHSECLWLIVSSLALNGNATETSIPFNWDTLGYLDIHTANGSSALQSLLANKPHDRPWAIVYSPGPILSGQDRAKKANDDDVTECGGNYDARNYLDPYVLDALGDVKNSLANTHNASDDPSDFNYRKTNPIKITTEGNIFKSGSNFLSTACTESDCSLLSNDRGLTLNSDTIFQAIRKRGFDSSTNTLKQPSFLFDVKDMLDKMTTCARDQVAASQISSNGKINAACSTDLDSFGPKGYYRNYGDLAFAATCAGCQVTVDEVLQPSCGGALLFASQRGANQLRYHDGVTDHRLNPDNYLDGENSPSYDQNRESYKSGGTTFSGPGNLGPIKADRSLPADQTRCIVGGKWKSTPECQTKEQDIVRCIPTGPSFPTVSSPLLGANQLAAYNPATRTLTLGRLGIESDLGYPASALYGCTWLADVRTLGSGLHTYFRFQFKKPEPTSTVGSNGFVFALADADPTRNSFLSCGAAGSHLAYSGNNGTTPKIHFPKIGIEFDQGRNTGAIENADPTLSGRNDPCGATSCGGTVGYNSHAAIVYWGHETGGADGVSIGMEDYDDNVHGIPSAPIGSRPPPPNPATAPGIQFINMRGYPDSSYDSRIFHVRVEVNQVPYRQLSAARVAGGANLNLSSPGASIDSIAMSAGNRVLVNAQASSAENGIYVWNGASTPMMRAGDADSAAEISESTVRVEEGTYAGSAWVQSLTVTTLGTDPQIWQPHVRQIRTEAWIEGDASLTDQIAALKNTTRPMSTLYPTYASTLSNTAIMYPIASGSCPCSSGQICGTDNICYRPALQSIQLGFTGSQRTQDQEVVINDFFTTWLP